MRKPSPNRQKNPRAPRSGSARAPSTLRSTATEDGRAVSSAPDETPRRAPAPVPSADAAKTKGDSPSPATPNLLIKNSPLDILLPYQRRLADDEARFKYALQARQTGKDFASGAEGIRDCFNHEREGRKTTWLIAAPSERQSLESLAKWKEWTEAFKLDIADSIEEYTEGNSESLIKSASIVFPHGSRVIAVPGKPDTVRGFSANILLTEFAFFEQPDQTWRAILPSITNPLRGGPKKCRLVTTPNGVGNKAHELWVNNYRGSTRAPRVVSSAPDETPRRATAPDSFGGGAESAGDGASPATREARVLPARGARALSTVWSCHRVDIHDAFAEGLAVNVEELREALNDPEGWAQEYEFNFLDQATVLLPYEVIVPCETAAASETAPVEFWQGSANPNAPLFLGIDFGRKKDLTVCWALELIAGQMRLTREVLTLANQSTPLQLDALRPRIKKAQRVCFDYTGPGVGLGDLLATEFGEWNTEKHRFGKIELCAFTNSLKLEIFPKLRMAFEQRTVSVPVNRVIREDLHSISRVALSGGGVTYRAPHTPDGHADRCTALALALRATTHVASVGSIRIFENTRQSRIVTERMDRSILG